MGEKIKGVGDLPPPRNFDEVKALPDGLQIGRADQFDGQANARTLGKLMTAVLPGMIGNDLSLKDALERSMLTEGPELIIVIGAGSFPSNT